MLLEAGDLKGIFLLKCLTTWISLYLFIHKVFTSRGSEWACRTVTVIHAVLISFMAGYCCFVEGPWPLTDAGGPNTPLQVTTATICLAYFLFDFTWCLYHKTEGLTMLLHHFMSIVGLSVSLLMGIYGTELVATICGGEITNPLLQLRWFLRQTGRKDTMAAQIVDYMFVFSFGFMRLGVGSVLLYCYFCQPTDYLGRFGAICIYSMGWIFWINIVQYAVKKYSKPADKKSVKIDLNSNGNSSQQVRGVTTNGHFNNFQKSSDSNDCLKHIEQSSGFKNHCDGNDNVSKVQNGFVHHKVH